MFFSDGGIVFSDAMVCCLLITNPSTDQSLTTRSPTTSFSHPLVNITTSNAGFRLSNYLSYAAADLLTWQGYKDFSRLKALGILFVWSFLFSIGDIINTFRTSTLGLPSLTLRSGPGIADYYKVPWTYCMSPSLVPKPDDWKNHIGMKPITGLGNE